MQLRFLAHYLQGLIFLSFTSSLVQENQSGFKPGDSRVNKLIAITHEVHSLLWQQR